MVRSCSVIEDGPAPALPFAFEEEVLVVGRGANDERFVDGWCDLCGTEEEVARISSWMLDMVAACR